MNVSLNIENDSELRAYIKDCIKGQMLSIAREELVCIIRDELQRKIKSGDTQAFNRILKESMFEVVKQILYKEHSVSSWNLEFIKPFVDDVVLKTISGENISVIVDQLAKEKLRSLIK